MEMEISFVQQEPTPAHSAKITTKCFADQIITVLY